MTWLYSVWFAYRCIVLGYAIVGVPRAAMAGEIVKALVTPVAVGITFGFAALALR
jgi:hypothetical protein